MKQYIPLFIKRLLAPYLRDELERAAIMRHIFSGTTLPEQVDGKGKTGEEYTAHVVDMCIKFGELESGKHA
ncbi:MAG: hypothetical protein AAF653_03200, partial [Chloroflexota bacterium]